MNHPLDNTRASRVERADFRDLARRAVVAAAAIAGLAGILAGRPVLTVITRAGIVCATGLALVAIAEAIVRHTRRRVVR